MLSAEHLALENEAVRQLLAIREKEIQFFTDKFNAISTQSALIAGFVITSLTAVPLQGQPGHENLESVFLISGALSMICCFYSLLCSTMAGIWGPSLSLRGPNGSVTKAWYELKKESKQIMISYLSSIVFFAIHAGCAFFLIDYDDKWTSSWIATIIVLLGVFLILIKLYFVKKRLSFDSTKNALDDTIIRPEFPSSNVSSSQQMGAPLLQNQFLSDHNNNNDTTNSNDNTTITTSLAMENNNFEKEGFMIKLGRRVGRLSEKKRYFILKKNKLFGFKDKATCMEILKANDYSLSSLEANVDSIDDMKIVNLIGYECMIDMDSMKKNYYPINLIKMDVNDPRGNKYFRVSTLNAQKEWAKAFVLASML